MGSEGGGLRWNREETWMGKKKKNTINLDIEDKKFVGSFHSNEF